MADVTPMTYLVKSGACTLPELSALLRSDKPTVDVLKVWAQAEMDAAKAAA